MNKKIVFSLMMFVLCIMGINAEEKNVGGITVTKSSEYSATIFSYNRVEVDFLDEENDSFIDGAKLKITDEKENTIVEWTTYDETAVIEGLSVGTYYLSLESQKDGYVMTEDKVKFEVEDELVALEFSVAKDGPGPIVISSTSVLMIFLALFDVILGMGMFIYAKKARN